MYPAQRGKNAANNLSAFPPLTKNMNYKLISLEAENILRNRQHHRDNHTMD